MKRKKNRNPELLDIRVIGDKILRQKAEPVTEIDDELLDFIEDLTHTMYERDGAGLAAPQVGRLQRIFVVDPFWVQEEKKHPVVFINPRIVECSGEYIWEEGCLSLPQVFIHIKRCKHLKMEALDIEGKPFSITVDNYYAVALQHEYDHLDGTLFIDRANKLKVIPWRKRIRELEEYTDANGVNLLRREMLPTK